MPQLPKFTADNEVAQFTFATFNSALAAYYATALNALAVQSDLFLRPAGPLTVDALALELEDFFVRNGLDKNWTYAHLLLLFSHARLNYRPFVPDVTAIAGWLQKIGAAVVIQSSQEIYTITGVANGLFIVRDETGYRPGVDLSGIQIDTATAILYPWIATIPQNYDPGVEPSIYPAPVYHTVLNGETLQSIGSEKNIPSSFLYGLNIGAIEAAAHASGYRASNDGAILMPGTVLEVG
jgi:hypothetical protein